MTTTIKTIRTDADALTYLAETGATVHLVEHATLGTVVEEDASCHRCGGTGWISSYAYNDGGICYGCDGAKTKGRVKRTPVKRYAQKLKAADTKAQRAVQKILDAKQVGIDFIANTPGLAAALENDHRILNDLGHKARKWGSLSTKQVALALKIASDLAARAAEPKGVCPTGKQTVTGTIIKAVERDGQYGTSYKMTVKVETPDGSYCVWGTIPTSIMDAGLEASKATSKGTLATLLRRTVTFTATFERSDKGEDFGFFKRPSKATMEALPEDVLTSATTDAEALAHYTESVRLYWDHPNGDSLCAVRKAALLEAIGEDRYEATSAAYEDSSTSAAYEDSSMGEAEAAADRQQAEMQR